MKLHAPSQQRSCGHSRVHDLAQNQRHHLPQWTRHVRRGRVGTHIALATPEGAELLQIVVPVAIAGISGLIFKAMLESFFEAKTTIDR